MSDDLVSKIKSRGYWRVNFRPTVPEDVDSVLEVKHLVERSTVSLRGWDFPHMPAAGLAGDNTAFLANGFQASTEWGDKHEFWRMYTSTQFLHLKSIRTDWLEEDDLNGVRSQNYPPNVLGLVDNIWHVTEVFEFLSRLTDAGVYRDGTTVSIGLMNTEGRSLHVDDFKRAELNWDYKTNAVDIIYAKLLSRKEIGDPRAQTKEAVRYIFDRFAFQPEEQVLDELIDELYGLNIGRG